MTEIIPSILVESEKDFENNLRLIEGIADTVQIDILDGTLFPVTNWANPEAVKAMRTKVSYELHLMVENPLAVAKKWKKLVPNVTRVIFHAELDRPHKPIIEEMKKLGLEVGMALNPETPINEARHEIDLLDELLIMTVHPGYAGQGAGDPKHGLTLEDLEGKISHIHKKYPKLILGADGGVNKNNIESLYEAGIRRFCIGSAIFKSENPAQSTKDFINILQERAA